MREDIEKRVKVLIKEINNSITLINEINDKESLNKLNIDSLSFIKFIVALEAEFDIEVDDDHLVMKSFHNLNDIINYVENCIKENSI